MGENEPDSILIVTPHPDDSESGAGGTIARWCAEGKKVGFVRVRWFRPFPTIELQEALGGMQAVGVIDRDYSFGSPFHSGTLGTELRSALYPLEKSPKIITLIAGLGGREVNADNVIEISDLVFDAAEGKLDDQDTYWIGVRE